MNNQEYIDVRNNKLDSIKDLGDVFKLFKQVIFKDLHVSSVAIFKRVIKEYDNNSGYGIIEVEVLPAEPKRGNYILTAYHIHKINFITGQLLEIVYTDMNFIQNLNVNKNYQRLITEKIYHSEMNALVVTGLVNQSLDSLEEVDLSTGDKSKMYIYVDDNGTAKKISIQDLLGGNNR